MQKIDLNCSLINKTIKMKIEIDPVIDINKILCFVHIPKSGGSTLREGLFNYFSSFTIDDWRGLIYGIRNESEAMYSLLYAKRCGCIAWTSCFWGASFRFKKTCSL